MSHFSGWRPKSLFTRFFLSFLVTLTISALAIIMLMPQQMENLLVNLAEDELISKMAKVRPTVQLYLSGRITYAEMQNNVIILESLLGGQIYVVDRNGVIRVSSVDYGNLLLRQRISDEDYQSLAAGEQITRREQGTITLASPIHVTARSPLMEQQVFFGALYLQVPLAALTTTALIARQQVRVMPLIVSFFAMLMSVLTAHSLSQPLQRMSNAALRMARGEYATRITEERDDELGQLGRSFNLMAVSLEVSVRSLKDERDRIRNLIFALTEGVIATDDQQRVLLLNPSAANYLHLDLIGSLGRPLGELPLPKSITQLLTSSSLLPQSNNIEEEGHVLSVATSPLSDGAGGLSGQIAIIKDITEAAKLEEQRRVFVANVSHELRTPLTSIQGFVEGILDQTVPPELQERYLNIIHQECIRLTRMIRELLDLSHFESGQMELYPEVVELRPMLQSIILQATSAAGREDLHWELELSPEAPLLYCDPDCLGQILLNLLSNATRFSPNQGVIRVRTAPQGEEEGAKLQIEISDQGPGIAAEDLPYIWDRFFKADRSRSSKGTGLGLAIVRSLVEAHQETIWVESRSGEGATFGFTMALYRV
ncbi:MAG: cell wall metabolism sensor histidine kinase WalK [Symbiobacteriaceae bacterium]|nr:cell wall metabolism sensor histidine kinase WalK [Symbiobacteriaceae bacterium]